MTSGSSRLLIRGVRDVLRESSEIRTSTFQIPTRKMVYWKYSEPFPGPSAGCTPTSSSLYDQPPNLQSRLFSASMQPLKVRPIEILMMRAEKVLQVTFMDGRIFRYPAELLRVTSPAADRSRAFAQGRTSERYPGGRRHVGIMSVEHVGNYAIRVAFDDLHSSGIFTWDFLLGLGQNKYAHMREYLQSLKRQGLSRDSSTRIRDKPPLQNL